MHETLWMSRLRHICSPIAGLGKRLLVKIPDHLDAEHVSPRRRSWEGSGTRVEDRSEANAHASKFCALDEVCASTRRDSNVGIRGSEDNERRHVTGVYPSQDGRWIRLLRLTESWAKPGVAPERRLLCSSLGSWLLAYVKFAQR
jgi:hypothetical protein